jgi:hypothetical protein
MDIARQLATQSLSVSNIELYKGGRTIQMTLDDELVASVDQVVKDHPVCFCAQGIKERVKQVNINLLEKKHKRGYGKHPADKAEFSVWE